MVQQAKEAEHMPAFPIFPGHSVLELTRAEVLTLLAYAGTKVQILTLRAASQALAHCARHYECARTYFSQHRSYVDLVAPPSRTSG
jgi:hypothetical protein